MGNTDCPQGAYSLGGRYRLVIGPAQQDGRSTGCHEGTWDGYLSQEVFLRRLLSEAGRNSGIREGNVFQVNVFCASRSEGGPGMQGS